MLKKRLISAITGLALFVMVAGLSGIIADSQGLSVTPQTYACENAGTSGGGC